MSDWIFVLVVGLLAGTATGVKIACDKLDRIIDLLIVANRQRDGDYDR